MNLLSVIAWLFGLVVMYFVVKLAVDNSETAENVREIRRFLSKHSPDCKPEDKQIYDTLDMSIHQCPACSERVSPKDKECPPCGLSLINIDR